MILVEARIYKFIQFLLIVYLKSEEQFLNTVYTRRDLIIVLYRGIRV